MENCKFVGYRVSGNLVINGRKSKNPLAKLSYKNLQEVARELHLPTKFKHKVLLALVIAKKQDRIDIVNSILNPPKKKTILISGNSLCKPQHPCSTQPSSNESHFDKTQFSGNISGLNNTPILNPQDIGGATWNLAGTPGHEYLLENNCDLAIPSTSSDKSEGICDSTTSNSVYLLNSPDISEHRQIQTLLEETSELKNIYDKAQESSRSSNMSLLLATPNVSFDSGQGSFCSFDSILDGVSLDDQCEDMLDPRLLDSCDVGDSVASYCEKEKEESLDFGMVDVLENFFQY